MQHRTNIIAGSAYAIARCSCGWTSKAYGKDNIQHARQDAADHIIAELQTQLPGLETTRGDRPGGTSKKA